MKKVEVFVLVVSSVVPFLPGIQDQFIFDDRPAVLHNKVLQQESLTELFYKDFWGDNILSNKSHKSYRPVTSITFFLQTKENMVNEGVAVRMKVVNLIINTTNCLLMYCWLNMVLTTSLYPSLPFFVALMFSVHPVHAEPVLSIVGRADLLYSCLFLVTLILSRLESIGTVLKYLLIFVLTLVSMLCKEQGILVLPMLLCMEMYKSSIMKKKNIIFLVFIISSVIILSYIRLRIINFTAPVFRKEDNPLIFTSGLTRVLSSLYLLSMNTLMLVLPAWLCFDWSMGCIPLVTTIFDARMMSILILIIFISGLTRRAWLNSDKKDMNVVYLSICLMIIPFLLCLNIVVHVGFVLAERNLYLSVGGYCLLYQLAVYSLYNRTTSKFQRSIITLMNAWVISSLILKTLDRSIEWKDEKSLYFSGLKVCPTNAKVFYNIAKLNSDQNQDSTLLYHHTILLEPNFEHALNNLANIYRGIGDFERSRVLLERAIKINPQFAAAYMNLGIVEMKVGKFELSRKYLEEALQLRYPYPDCVYNLGILQLKMNNLKEAEQSFRLGVDWNHQLSYLNLIILLDNSGRIKESREICELGITLFPDKSDFRFHLANALGQMNEYESSELQYLTAIKMEQKENYYLNLGILYHRWGKLKEAQEVYTSILKSNPSHSKAKIYLKQIVAKNQ